MNTVHSFAYMYSTSTADVICFTTASLRKNYIH